MNIGLEYNVSRLTGTPNYRIVNVDDKNNWAGYKSDTIYLFFEDAHADAVSMGMDSEKHVEFNNADD